MPASMPQRKRYNELGLTGGQTSGIKESSSLHFVEEGGPGTFGQWVARNCPLISGGGPVDVGLSSPVGSGGSRLWYGIGGYPYDGLVFSLKGDVRISEHVALTPTVYLKGGDAFEYGRSIGGRTFF